MRLDFGCTYSWRLRSLTFKLVLLKNLKVIILRNLRFRKLITFKNEDYYLLFLMFNENRKAVQKINSLLL